MQKNSRYDYDDMILQVVHAMEVYDDLRYTLQEKYLYIMVDEFQDTNPAQLRILHNLTDSPVHDGAPNLLAVGDDDQAIYGFQGADISNILTFADQYPRTQRIVLTDNYRSGEAILQASRAVIIQGGDRLERRLPDIDKQLTPHHKGSGNVQFVEAPTIMGERHWVATSIAQRIAEGVSPSSIAVLARQHDDLKQLLPYFSRYNVTVRYEHQDNALDQPPIKALELLARVVTGIAYGRHDEVNALLPELLSHPAWHIPPYSLWELSITAHEARLPWVGVMPGTPQLKNILDWLVVMARDAAHLGVEELVDRLIGRPIDAGGGPFYEYYFGAEALKKNPSAYLDYLSALRVIRSQLADFRPGEGIVLLSFIEFIDMHRRLGTVITVPRVGVSLDTPAVSLLTAHKSKGMEFDIVYIVNAVDSTWGQTVRSHGSSLSYPENLPLSPGGSTPDERLRLFYVAMTRARDELTISYSATNDKNKATLRADFLVDSPIAPTILPEPSFDEQVEAAEIAWYEPLRRPTRELKELLAPRLESYKLSATDLTSFLDVVNGGPQGFLLNKLLRFPQATSPAAAYGNAVHKALQQAHVHVLATGEQKPLEDILHDFEIALARERIDPNDQVIALEKGSDQLPVFLAAPSTQFSANQKTELPFSHQGTRLGEVALTGKLDVITIDHEAKTIIVTDYKTGRPPLSWKASTDYEKHKLHKYRQQLLFYKILIEGSRDFRGYTVTEGRLAFVQPTNRGDVITLTMEFDPAELERTKKLIRAVGTRIIALDLPDSSAYPSSLEGVIKFENDLIDGNA